MGGPGRGHLRQDVSPHPSLLQPPLAQHVVVGHFFLLALLGLEPLLSAEVGLVPLFVLLGFVFE